MIHIVLVSKDSLLQKIFWKLKQLKMETNKKRIVDFIIFLFLEKNLNKRVEYNFEEEINKFKIDGVPSTQTQLIKLYKSSYKQISDDGFKRIMALPYLITTGNVHKEILTEALENFYPVKGIGFVQVDFYNYFFENNTQGDLLLKSDKSINIHKLNKMYTSLSNNNSLNKYFGNVLLDPLISVEKSIASINKNTQYVPEGSSLLLKNLDDLLAWSVDYSPFRNIYIKWK